eukprot:tig00000545_g2002.t1
MEARPPPPPTPTPTPTPSFSLAHAALSLKLGFSSLSDLGPLAGLERLEHLALDGIAGPALDLRPLAALTSLRSLPLARLKALGLQLSVGAVLDPFRLLRLGPRLRCLELEACQLEEGPAASAALAEALAHFDALQARARPAPPPPTPRRPALGLSCPAPFLSRVAGEMRGLRELAVYGRLPLPFPDDAAAALRMRGRLRRVRAALLDPPARQAELEEALGVKFEPYPGFENRC